MNHTRCDPESETAADGIVTHTAYDAEGHTLATWGATYPVAYAYDRLGRMTSAVVAGISTNAYAYDPETLALSAETQNGMQINRSTDALGRDTGFSLGPDYAVSYAYDAYGRFHSVTSSVRSMSPRSGKSAQSVAIYSYLPNSDLVAGMTASSGFLWTRAYESSRSLITSVENRFGETVISRYDYENDALGRRTAIASSGEAFTFTNANDLAAFNLYGYNGRSEVTSAARYWGTDTGDTSEAVDGQQYAYAFDPIGNRVTASEGDTSRTATYTANELNQYTQRTVPGVKELAGTALTNATVTVNGLSTDRHGPWWRHAFAVDNGSAAAYTQAVVTAVYNPPGTNDSDVVTSATGSVFVAETPEAFTYNDDGNLLSDGRFTYTWDGENRLIGVTTRVDLLASVPRVRVEYAYDHQGRMAWKQISTNAVIVSIRTLLWDGYNIIRETINHQPSTTNYYVWGLDLSGSLQGAGGVGALLAEVKYRMPYFAALDANGNVTEYVSGDGVIAAHYEYSPFGEIIVQSGDLADSFTHRFSTKPWCAVTGLSEYLFRKYGPGMGQWLSRDPRNELGFKNGQDFRSRRVFHQVRDRMAMSFEQLASGFSGGSADATLAGAIRNLVARLRSVSYEEFAASSGTLYHFVCNNPINVIDFLGLEEGDPYEQPWPPNEPGEGKEGDWSIIFKALWKWFEQNHKQDIDEVKQGAAEWAKENKATTCCIAIAGGTCYVIGQKVIQDKIEIKIPNGWITIGGAEFSAEVSRDFGKNECKIKFQLEWKF